MNNDSNMPPNNNRRSEHVERELLSDVYSTHPEGWITEVHRRIDARLHKTHVKLHTRSNATLDERLEAEDAMKARRSHLQEHRRMAVLREAGRDTARTALAGGDPTIAAYLLRVPVGAVSKVAGSLRCEFGLSM